MFRKTLIFFFFLGVKSSLYAGSSGVKVQAKMNYKKKAMEITCFSEKNYPCTVELCLDELENFDQKYKRGDVIHVVVSKGQDAFLTLKTKSDVVPRISISSDFIKGNLTSKPDLDYTYLLPVSNGKTAQVKSLKYNGRTADCDLDPKGWYGLSFKTCSGDTIYASRRGIVTGLKASNASTETKMLHSFQENFVEICHADGSFATYRLFQNNGIFVNEGDMVEAGQPIGIIGGENYAEGSHLCFTVSHPMAEQASDGNQSKTKYFREYIQTKFYTKENPAVQLSDNSSYTAIKTLDLVTREMTKAEKKAFTANVTNAKTFGLLTLR